MTENRSVTLREFFYSNIQTEFYMLKIEIKEGNKLIQLGELDETRWKDEIQQKLTELTEDHIVDQIIITRTGIPEPEEEKGIVCLTCRKKPEECECPEKSTPEDPQQK